jgi:hypothetical protein
LSKKEEKQILLDFSELEFSIKYMFPNEKLYVCHGKLGKCFLQKGY